MIWFRVFGTWAVLAATFGTIQFLPTSCERLIFSALAGSLISFVFSVYSKGDSAPLRDARRARKPPSP